VFKNNVSKRLTAFILALVAVTCLLSSCKSRVAYDAYDLELSEYLNAGDLTKIQVSSEEVETSVTNRLYAVLWQNSLFTNVTESDSAKMYDKLIVDYTCAIDGLVIDAFGGKDASVFIGSDTMIDGMEEGLIGLSVGEEKEMELTFPDEYYSDLGGKKGVFRVKVKNIFRPEQLTDEIVKKYTVYDTVHEMREKLTRVIASELAFNIIYERAEVLKYPEEEYNRFYADVSYLEEYAKENKMTIVEFLEKFGDQFTEYGFEKGMTEAEYKTACEEYAKRITKEDMLTYHILRELKVKTGGSAYRNMKKRLLRDYNMSDIDNFDDVYGKGAFDSAMRKNLMLDALYERVELN